MDRKSENGIFVMAMLIIFAIIALSLLASCRTTKTTTTEVYVHDTLRIHSVDTVYITRHKTDSVIDIRTVIIHDSVVHDKGVVIVLNEAGDTIKEKSWNNTKQSTHGESNTNVKQSSADSLAIYKAKVDSILKVLDQRKSEKQVKTKPPIAWWEYVLFVAILLSVSIWVLRSKTFFKD